MGVIDLVRPAAASLVPAPRKREHVILPPGRIYASADAVTVVLTIGSGVAVCVLDAEAKVGGVVHYLLPATDGWEHAIRCGSGAIPALIERVIALGGRRESLTAKIFGGARIIRSDCAQGPLNVRTAVETLNAAGIPIMAADIEGDRARRLVFHADEGRTWVKRV